MNIQLFDKTNIADLPWPNTLQGLKAKKFLTPLMVDGVNKYIDNINTDLRALLIDDVVLPITISEANESSSLACSPYAHYISYSGDKLPRKARFFLGMGIKLLGTILKLGKVNKVVMVNNWLISTNLYPKLSQEQVEMIKSFLTRTFPDHTLIFRSINDYQLPELSSTLKKKKFDFIPGRIVFFTKSTDDKAFSSRMFKSDLSVLKNSPYEIVNLYAEDAERAEDLYHKLNIEKHSKINTQYNSRFIELAIRNKLLVFKGLKKEGKLDAVIGYFSQDNVMTSPFFGYDTSLPSNVGLYRQLSTILLQEAKKAGMSLNHSAGAGSYKKLRRAEPAVEYNAVYFKHLPLHRRFPWKVLKFGMDTIGIKFMQKLS